VAAERTRRRQRALRLVRTPTRRAEAMHAARVNVLLLLVPAAVLTMLGLVMVLSAGSVSATQGYDGNPFWYFQRQSIYALVGVVALLIAVRMPHTVWQKLAVPLLVALLPLMFIALHPSAGSSLYGASRWIDLGPVTLQPSEFMKFAVVAFAATVLTKKWKRLDDPGHLLVPLAPVVVGVALIVILQRDLGTTVIICGSVFVLLFAAGVRLRYLAVTGAGALAATAFLIFGEAYRRTRFVDAFLNPWNDPDGAGFQLIQGMIAFGSGGWIGLQTIINLGAVTGLLPITGVPLPLLSFGGTALVVMLASIGVLASIARASAQAASTTNAGRRGARRVATVPRATAARVAPSTRPRRKAADGRARR